MNSPFQFLKIIYAGFIIHIKKVIKTFLSSSVSYSAYAVIFRRYFCKESMKNESGIIRYSLFCFHFSAVLNLVWYSCHTKNGLDKRKSGRSEPIEVQICHVKRLQTDWERFFDKDAILEFDLTKLEFDTFEDWFYSRLERGLYNKKAKKVLPFTTKQATEYGKTLFMFLRCERNHTLTASHLFIHRNTLFLRLRNIQEIWHPDLEHEENRFLLLYTFYHLHYNDKKVYGYSFNLTAIACSPFHCSGFRWLQITGD